MYDQEQDQFKKYCCKCHCDITHMIKKKGNKRKYCDTCAYFVYKEQTKQCKRKKQIKRNDIDLGLGNPKQDYEILRFIRRKRKEEQMKKYKGLSNDFL